MYANIRNRTVADECFKVSEKVEALYDLPNISAPAEGAEMRKLSRDAPADARQRLLHPGRRP